MTQFLIVISQIQFSPIFLYRQQAKMICAVRNDYQIKHIYSRTSDAKVLCTKLVAHVTQ